MMLRLDGFLMFSRYSGMNAYPFIKAQSATFNGDKIITFFHGHGYTFTVEGNHIPRWNACFKKTGKFPSIVTDPFFSDAFFEHPDEEGLQPIAEDKIFNFKLTHPYRDFDRITECIDRMAHVPKQNNPVNNIIFGEPEEISYGCNSRLIIINSKREFADFCSAKVKRKFRFNVIGENILDIQLLRGLEGDINLTGGIYFYNGCELSNIKTVLETMGVNKNDGGNHV